MEEQVKWYYRPWGALLIIFLLAGPLGLPLVYKSPKFNRLAKILVTAAMIPFTWFMVVATVEAVQKAMLITSILLSN